MNGYALLPDHTGTIGSWADRPPVLPDNATDAVPDLIAFAAGVLGIIIRSWSEPAQLMQAAVMSLAERRLGARWMRQLEMFVRRLILVIAVNLVLAPVRPRTGANRPQPRRPFTPHDPASWRVSFRMLRFPRARAARPATKPPANDPFRDPHRPVSGRGLARRMEAARRILAKPDGYARRFARMLARIREDERTGLRSFRLGRWQPPDPDRPVTILQRTMAPKMPFMQALATRELRAWDARSPEPG